MASINSGLSLNEVIPPEIIVHILLLYIEDFDWAERKTETLALVCRTWRDLVYGTSRFWKWVHISAPIERRTFVLDRNPNGQLAIVCTADKPITTEDVMQFLRDLGPCAQRWDTLWFEGEIHPRDVELLHLDSPRLTDLRLHLERPGEGIFHIENLFDFPYEKGLRVLQLVGVSTSNWTSPRLDTLVGLYLEGPPAGIPSAEQLYHLITHCHQLEELNIHSTRTYEESSASTQSWKRVNLPRLVSLKLTDVSDAAFEMLLSSIETPDCRKLKVRGASCRAFGQARGFSSAFARPYNHCNVEIWSSGPGAGVQISSRPAALYDAPETVLIDPSRNARCKVDCRLQRSTSSTDLWEELLPILSNIGPHLSILLGLPAGVFSKASVSGEVNSPPLSSRLTHWAVGCFKDVVEIEVRDPGVLLDELARPLDPSSPSEYLAPRLQKLTIESRFHTPEDNLASLRRLILSPRWAAAPQGPSLSLIMANELLVAVQEDPELRKGYEGVRVMSYKEFRVMSVT